MTKASWQLASLRVLRFIQLIAVGNLHPGSLELEFGTVLFVVTTNTGILGVTDERCVLVRIVGVRLRRPVATFAAHVHALRRAQIRNKTARQAKAGGVTLL